MPATTLRDTPPRTPPDRPAARAGGLTDIVIRGAREHNLQDLTLRLPRQSLIVITGVSGSGKSSLAFDTLYAEGQRRYVESLSAYARQFLGQMEKPEVDAIEGLSPAIAIEQRGAGSNPRSTVATITEIYDYLRLLFARLGVQFCPNCGTRMSRQTVQEIVDAVLAQCDGAKIALLAPLVRGRKAICARASTARGSSSRMRRSSRRRSAMTSTSSSTASPLRRGRARGSPIRSRRR
jgi:excinuclease ABC subunit A